MHIRKITWNKSSFLISIPPQLLGALKITRGDHVIVTLKDKHTIEISKLDTKIIRDLARNKKERI